MFNFFKRDNSSTASQFWNWFIQNKDHIKSINENEAYGLKLLKMLQRYHKGLTYVIGQNPDGKMDFIISCDGIKSGIPHVKALAEAAPPIPGWNIIPFRPPMPDAKGVEMEGFNLEYESILVEYSFEGGMADIDLYIDGYKEKDDRFLSAAFILLDNMFGEYFVMTKIGEIHFHPMEEAEHPENLISLEKLKERTDYHMS